MICSLAAEEGNMTNKLINESSPYLLQHAHNPVDWYPWGEEAFETAKKEDKPIFLSIGYSTCHWCHVMEKESFEDADVAELMNKTFINIKVDREERPDIDQVYMNVATMLTGSGGWPLTIIMTPEKEPFFAGTYFPKEERFGRIGMMELIPQIDNAWKTKRKEINKTTSEIKFSLQTDVKKGTKKLDKRIIQTAFEQLKSRFDEDKGGFGSSPKFPSPHNLMFLLRVHKNTGGKEALKMAETTLTEMRKGGIYDHVGFGFHRYSTDADWLVPHFEKMLYDQAMLVMAYTEAYEITGNEVYKSAAEEILQYILRDMTSAEGGFYSAEDADSEGIEGKFYVWETSELQEVLNENEAEFVKKYFRVKDAGNFHDESTRKKNGKNILHTSDLDYDAELWNNIRNKLYTQRESRIHPLKDDKILTDWNGLMIAAFAKAGSAFEEPKYITAAEKAAEFINEKLTIKGQLMHRYRKGNSKVPAFLDDYSFFTFGLMSLYEATFDLVYLERAIELTEKLNANFYDNENGGYHFTSDSAEELFTRTKDGYDGAYPSGNSIALMNLVKLGKYTAEAEIQNKADEISKAFGNHIERAPMGFTQFLSAMDYAMNPSSEVIVVGESDNPVTVEMLNIIDEGFNPQQVVLLKTNANVEKLADIAPFTKDYTMIDGNTTVYVCKDYNCSLPVTEPDELRKLLKK